MNQRGLTLIECLLAIGLYATVLLIIIPCVRGGLELTKREGDLTDRSQEIRLFFDKLGAELENAVPFTPAPFEGHENEIAFVAPVADLANGAQPRLSEVRYWAEEGQLYRKVSDLSLLLQDKENFERREKVWIEDLRDLSFEFAYGSEEQNVVWQDTWQTEKNEKVSMPFAIRVTLSLDGSDKAWEKVFFMPDGVRKVKL